MKHEFERKKLYKNILEALVSEDVFMLSSHINNVVETDYSSYAHNHNNLVPKGNLEFVLLAVSS